MSGRKTITYINFLQGIPAPIVALGGMIKVFLFYPLSCVTLQKNQPDTSQKLYVTQNFCVSVFYTHTTKTKHPTMGVPPRPLLPPMALCRRRNVGTATPYDARPLRDGPNDGDSRGVTTLSSSTIRRRVVRGRRLK